MGLGKNTVKTQYTAAHWSGNSAASLGLKYPVCEMTVFITSC